MKLALPSPTLMLYDNATAQVLAHALGHAFRLGDEYVEFRTNGSYKESYLDGWANLTTSDTFINAARSVWVGDVKWNWHRIRKASVLTRAIKPEAHNVFHAYVGPARGPQFSPRDPSTPRPGDNVRLRTRPAKTAINRLPPIDTSAVEFKVIEVHQANIDDPVDHVNMTLVLKADAAVATSAFGDGSLSYVPVPAR